MLVRGILHEATLRFMLNLRACVAEFDQLVLPPFHQTYLDEHHRAQGYAAAAEEAARHFQSLVAQKILSERRAATAKARMEMLHHALKLERSSGCVPVKSQDAGGTLDHGCDARRLRTLVIEAEASASLDRARPPPVSVPESPQPREPRQIKRAPVARAARTPHAQSRNERRNTIGLRGQPQPKRLQEQQQTRQAYSASWR